MLSKGYIKKIAASLCTALSLFACNNSSDEKKTDIPPLERKEIAYYKDIDEYNLTGITPVTDLTTYPYIKIEEEKDRKKMVYMINRKDSVVRIYEKSDLAGTDTAGIFFSMWWFEYSYKEGKDSMIMTELVYPNMVAEFLYVGPRGKDAYLLKGVFIYHDSTITCFDFEKPDFCPDPNIAFIDNIKSAAKTIVTERKELTGNHLQIITSTFDKKKNKITYIDTSCFNGGNRSWAWLGHFSGQLAPCR